MTRSEEEVTFGKRMRERGRVRLNDEREPGGG
jgi:hypothetical protein